MEPDSEQTSHAKQIIAGVVVLVVIVVIVAVASMGGKDEKTNTDTDNATTPSTSSTETDPTTDTSATYKDGTYSATGGYNSPGGSQEIGVTVTLKDGVVTDSQVEAMATDAEAEEYQDDFVANYKDQVVGKKINSIKLNRVAGSSLTPIGFNNALVQIEDQAEA